VPLPQKIKRSASRNRDALLQRVKKVILTRCADFRTLKNVLKSCFIERAGDFLSPAHTPCCSVTKVFFKFFDSRKKCIPKGDALLFYCAENSSAA
jgi:hypothetical protein